MSKFSCCFRKLASPYRGSNRDVSIKLSDVENVRFYTYKDLQVATGNFKQDNKIGQGGFGSVYKGILKDGLVVAIKVLSADSRQGLREFLNEITVISDIQHENLVKLHGYCIEGDHRILVYGYLKNGSLDQTLLGNNDFRIRFTWEIRRKMCIGVAKGLAYLHEEMQPHIIHRDIKASNILLDEDFTPKISDFGLAKLFPAHLTHVSTRIAGTQGYLAPEYALRGHLTRKADIYSFGILLLEIVSRRRNLDRRLPDDEQYLLQHARRLHWEGDLERLVDTSAKDVDIYEACRYLKIGLLCTHSLPKRRPSMSDVLKMLNDNVDVEFGENESLDSGLSSSGSRKEEDSSSGNTITSYATMTFTTIGRR